MVTKQAALKELARRELEKRSKSDLVTLPPISPDLPMTGTLGSLNNVQPSYSPEFVKQTGLGLAEGYTAGLPRIAIEKSTGMEIPRGNALGQIGGFMLGPGKIAGMARDAVKIPGMIGSTLGGLTEGAVGGLLFPQKELLSPERALSTAGGGLLGAATGFIGGGIQAFQKIRSARKAIKALEEERFALRNPVRVEEREGVQGEIKTLRQQKSEAIKAESDSFKEQSKAISEAIKKEAESKAQTIKKPIVDYMRNFKDEWGQSFEEALQAAPEQGINFNDLKKIEEDTVNELLEMGIDPKGGTVKTIRRNVRRFAPRKEQVMVMSQEPNELGMLVGRPEIKEITADSLISNLDLIKMHRNVNRSLSERAFSGQFSEEEIAGAIFNSKLAEKLSSTVGERLTELNGVYKDFKDISKFAYKNFRPKASEYEISSGSNILKRFALGKTNEGENKAIALIEKETGMKFTKNLEDLGNDLKNLKSKSPEKIRQIEGKTSRTIRELEQKKADLKGADRKKAFELDSQIRAHRQILEDFSNLRKVGKIAATGAAISASSLIFGNVIGKNIRQAFDASH